MYVNPLNLLVISHYYGQHRGGVEIVAEELVQALSQKFDLSITWVASNTDSAPENQANLTCLPVETINIIERILHFAYPLWGMGTYSKLKRQIQQADIVHLHEYIYVGNIMAFLIAKKLHKPIVITQHIGFIPYKSSVLKAILTLVNKTLGRWMLGKAEQVVFCSDVIRDYWFSLNLNFSRSPVLITNGVNTDIFYPVAPAERQQLRQELGGKQDRLIILFVGRFIEKKGLHLIKQLVLQYPTIDWWFAGWGPLDPDQWQFANVRVFSDRQGPQLTPLYQASDLLILPSTGEAFPLVIQEAMACGTPAFVSQESANQYPDLKELIFAEAVDQGDSPARWSQAIQAMVSQPSLLGDRRQGVAAAAQKKWSWQSTAQKYHDVFRQRTGPG